MFETTRFHPDTETAAQWAGYHAFRRARLARLRPWEEAPPDNEVEERLRAPHPESVIEHYAIRDGDAVAAFFTLQVPDPAAPEFAGGGHICRITGDVLAPWRRRGIGTEFLATVQQFAHDHGATVVEANTKEDDGHAFLTHLGAERRSAQIQSRLRLDTVDHGLLREWRRDGESRSPGTSVQIFTHRIPPEHLEDIGVAYTQLINDVPFDALEHGRIDMSAERLRDWYAVLDRTSGSHDVCLLREPDGSIAALCDIGYTGDEPSTVGQRFTGVRRDRRGRGYAKWVKAALIEHVRRSRPSAEWMSTENAESNVAMLGINRQLGFTPDLTKAVYQMSRDDLAARLKTTGMP
ncbi:MAG TPA: GNAT family N-acetyltransferase [Mycobacteriales bacterium]|nr:GNAT family N-acetyltransferase [Mycobacteriales bacterium]